MERFTIFFRCSDLEVAQPKLYTALWEEEEISQRASVVVRMLKIEVRREIANAAAVCSSNLSHLLLLPAAFPSCHSSCKGWPPSLHPSSCSSTCNVAILLYYYSKYFSV